MNTIFRNIIAAFVFFLSSQICAWGQQAGIEEKWTGKLIGGKVITYDDLQTILVEHRKYMDNRNLGDAITPVFLGASLTKANLSGADLRGFIMSGSKLEGADLSGANLQGALLDDADLSGANLEKANLSWTRLDGAILVEANLTDANLISSLLLDANLTGTFFQRANLSNAKLINANLSESHFEDAILINTDASFSNFSYSSFSPADIKGIVFLGAKGLSTLNFKSSQKVVEMRKIARESGLRSEERALTASLRKYSEEGKNFGEKLFENILINIPTGYGAKPWRCFKMIGICILIFTIPYFISITGNGKDGIWQVWLADRVRRDLGEIDAMRLKLSGLQALRAAFYFSMLSAFSIGWRELNVGNWISRIQPREYILRATGWTRTVSGFQSLLSVYLLALWGLTYFSRPFE